MNRILAITALTAAFAFGQGPGRFDHGDGTPPDPATMIAHRVDRLATLLSLTDAQKTQATTIFTNAYTAAQTPHTNLDTARQSLADAIKANSTTTIDQLAATIGAATTQITAIDAKANAAFYAILTADQQAKYDALPNGGGFGGPGGPGPRGFGRRQ